MLTFLLVDDHQIVRTGLKMILEKFFPGCTVDEAVNGETGFEKIRSNRYDIIILDVNMPNTDSFTLVGNILTLKPGAKIIMFSMNAEEIYAQRFLKAGAMGYVRKDSPEEEILKALKTVLNGKKYMSEELADRIIADMQYPTESQNPFDKLTTREFEIAQLLIKGASQLEIRGKLGLHASTIATHKAHILEKMQCNNILDLSALAKANNIII